MKFDLEDRLIDFTVSVIKLIEVLPDNKSSNHLAGQLLRSSTSPSLVYGEACAPESTEDFIHKMGVALKELRETRICLKIIQKAGFAPDQRQFTKILNENNEMVAIFGSSINTARKKLK